MNESFKFNFSKTDKKNPQNPHCLHIINFHTEIPSLLEDTYQNNFPCLLDLGFNPFPNKPWFLHVCRTSLLKTLREKEKLLIMSNFSFSHSVFYLFVELSVIFKKFEVVVCKHFQFGRVLNLSFGKGLTLHHTVFSFKTRKKGT